MMTDWLRAHVQRHVELIKSLDLAEVDAVISLLAAARDTARKIFVCGNGGSAASASHLSVDLGKGASLGQERRFRIFSLVDNVAWLTALGNDIGYDSVFVEQMANLATPGDLLIALSVSGNSPNVIKAVEYANDHAMTTIGLCGHLGGKLAKLAQHVVRVGSGHFGHCEDAHMFICHLIGYAFIENKDL